MTDSQQRAAYYRKLFVRLDALAARKLIDRLQVLALTRPDAVRELETFLGHDHHAIAALHAEIVKLPGGIVDGLHEFRRAQTPLVFDQHNMLRIAGGDARGNLRNTRGQCGEQGIDINFHLKSPCRASTRER